jgi:sarcosine oxidase subunit beta
MSAHNINGLRPTEDPPTVAVVGGGIAGLTSATFLARRGANVTVFEQQSIGAGSSPLAAGGVRTQFDRTPDITMMAESVQFWESLAASEGEPALRYRQAGYLMGIRDSEQAAAMEEVLAKQRSLGQDNHLLEPEEATSRCPGLNPEPFEAVTYGARDGYLEPHSALMRFKQLAVDAGATLRTNCGVEELQLGADGRVTGVRTAAGTLDTDAVVNAAGAWAPTLAASAGVSLPITPKARRAATVIPESQPEQELPLVVDFGSGVYFRPLDDNRMLVGGHFDDIGPAEGSSDPTVAPSPKPHADAPLDWKREALERAADCATYFGPDAQLVDTWEGRYGMTPGENPIIEESKPGLYTAAGFSGHGLMMAPATGQLVADLVLGSDAPLVDPAAYSRARFTDSGAEDASESEAVPQF